MPSPWVRRQARELEMPRTRIMGHMYPWWLKNIDGFRDISWKNDATDSVIFKVVDRWYLLWIGHEDPSRRDLHETNGERYSLCLLDPRNSTLDEPPELWDSEWLSDFERDDDLRSYLIDMGAPVR